jgi:putative transposase
MQFQMNAGGKRRSLINMTIDLAKSVSPPPKRPHLGQGITLKSNIRYCSDILEIRCWNDEKVFIAFSLDCCDREALS